MNQRSKIDDLTDAVSCSADEPVAHSDFSLHLATSLLGVAGECLQRAGSGPERGLGRALVNFAWDAWGYEVFSPEETSAENEMSVVQASAMAVRGSCRQGDAGRGALAEAAEFAPAAGFILPGVSHFQVPHHSPA